MVFQDTGKEEALVTFSPQMYKIIGLTPDMISSLKKTMNYITFNSIFHFKYNNILPDEQKCFPFQELRFLLL